ncbi:hypothetical protein ES703_99593 [subsurface metagenome]
MENEMKGHVLQNHLPLRGKDLLGSVLLLLQYRMYRNNRYTLLISRATGYNLHLDEP